MWHPFRENDAIESVSLRVVTSQGLSQLHQRAIQADDAEILNLMPKKSLVQGFFAAGPDGVKCSNSEDDPAFANAPACMEYAKINDGNIESQLDVKADAISVTKHLYTGWDSVREFAHKVFSFVGKGLGAVDTLHIAALELNYKDVFWCDSAWCDGVLEELLVRNSGYVPNRAFKEKRPIWHSEQGWILEQPVFPGEEMVERVFMQGVQGVVDEKAAPVVILHTILRWSSVDVRQHLPMTMQTAFHDDSEGNEARSRFNAMHARALSNFQRALTPSMLERVGIKEVS